MKYYYVCKLLLDGLVKYINERIYNMLIIVDEEYIGVYCFYIFNFLVDLKIFKYKNGKNL